MMGILEAIVKAKEPIADLGKRIQEEQKASGKPRVVLYIHDPKTGLDWLTWDTKFTDALAFCEQNKDTAGGGWRLPTIEELRTLVLPDEKPAQ